MTKILLNLFQANNFCIGVALCLAILFFDSSIAQCQEANTLNAAPKHELQNVASISVLFLGDTSFGENYPGTIELLTEKGYDYPLQKVAPLLADTDLIIANLETPVTSLRESPLQDTKPYIHWTDIYKAPKTFRKYNLRTFSLANNHTLDFGLAGLQETLKIMSENDLQWFGAGLNEQDAAHPYVKEFIIGGKPFTIVVIGAFEYSRNYNRAFNFYAKDSEGGTFSLAAQSLANQIRSIKKNKPDAYVILFPHWGRNYSWKTEQQTKYAHFLIKCGVDLIVGHGGHAMQEIEKYHGRWIIYGLGNFVFLSDGRYAEQNWFPYSFAAKLTVVNLQGKLEKHLRLYPLFSDNLQTAYQPRPLAFNEFKEFQQLLLSKSPLTRDYLREIYLGQDAFGFFLQFQND